MRTMQDGHLSRDGRRPSLRRLAVLEEPVLTSEGRLLLERKAAALKADTVPSLWAAMVEDRGDERARDAYEAAVAELHRLESVLALAEPVPAQPRAGEQINLGDRVTVRDSHGSTDVVLLVHPLEAPLDSLRISVTSPLGQALLGREVGDRVEFDSPTGRRVVRVLDRTPSPHQR